MDPLVHWWGTRGPGTLLRLPCGQLPSVLLAIQPHGCLVFPRLELGPPGAF